MLKAKILVADAHTLTREGIKSILSRKEDIQICGEAKDNTELPKELKRLKPDIVIIDFYVPNYFSIEDIAFIRKKYPHIRIVVISTNTKKEDVLKVLDLGVNSYLLKECSENEVISAVYAATQKEKFFCGRVMDAILEKTTHYCTPDSVCEQCQEPLLSEREIEIIKLITEGFTTHEIAEKLILSFHTISTHRKNIYNKLNIRSSSELIVYAMKKGIIALQNPEQLI